MRQSALDEIDLSGVYGEWDAAVDRHQETLEVADAEVAKTDLANRTRRGQVDPTPKEERWASRTVHIK